MFDSSDQYESRIALSRYGHCRVFILVWCPVSVLCVKSTIPVAEPSGPMADCFHFAVPICYGLHSIH